MLRVLLIGVAALVAAAGLGMMGAGQLAAGGWTLFCGALLLLGTLYERVRYKRLERKAPGPGWERTPERFIDDETGKPITVWVQPGTGERAYVQD